MAEPLIRVDRQRGPARTPDQSSLQGQANAVQNLGAAASAMQQLGQAQTLVARVTAPLANTLYGIGKEIALDRAMQKELPPMTDAEGNMIPWEDRFTLNIEQAAYQRRGAKAWAQEAEHKFRKEAGDASRVYIDPADYGAHMDEYASSLLENAPSTVVDPLRSRFAYMSEGMRNHLAQQDFTRRKQAESNATLDNINHTHNSAAKIATRAGTVQDPEGNLHPDINAEVLRSISAIDALGPEHGPSKPLLVRKELERWNSDLLQWTFDNAARAQERENGSEAEVVSMELRKVRDAIIDGEIPVTGFTGLTAEERGAVRFADLMPEDQERLRQRMDRIITDRVARSQLARDVLIDQERRSSFGVTPDAIRLQAPDLPNDWQKLIDEEATIVGVDPMMVKTMAYIESGYKPNAVSKVKGMPGARGVMQIMPDTARRVLADMRAKFPGNKIPDPKTDAELFDLMHRPDWSIRMGAHYMGMIRDEMVKRGTCSGGCHGIEQMSIMAMSYNWGEHNLDHIGKLMEKPAWGELMASFAQTTSEARLTAGYAFDEQWGKANGVPTETVHHARKMVARYGGADNAQRLMNEGLNQINDRWSHAPYTRDAMTGALVRDIQDALSVKRLSESLFYAPPIYQEGMARSYTEARLGGVPTPSMQAAAASWIATGSDNAGVSSDMAIDLQGQVYTAAGLAAANRGNASIANLIREGLYTSTLTGPEALKLDQAAVQMGLPVSQDPFGEFAMRTMDPATLDDTMSDFYDRFTLRSNLTNGNLPAQAISFMSRMVSGAADGSLAGPPLAAGGSLARLLMEPGPILPMPMERQSFEAVKAKRLDNFARLYASGRGDGTLTSDAKAAMLYVMRNADELADVTKPAERRMHQERVQALLRGALHDGSYEKLPKEERTKLMDKAVELRDTSLRRARQNISYSAGNNQLDSRFDNAVTAKMAEIMATTSEYNVDSLADRAIEIMTREGTAGFSSYGLPFGINASPDYDPAKPSWVLFPLEHYLSSSQEYHPEYVGNLLKQDQPVSIPVRKDGKTTWEQVPVNTAHPVGFAINAWNEWREAHPESPDIDLKQYFAEGKAKLHHTGQVVAGPYGSEIPVVTMWLQMGVKNANRYDWVPAATFAMDTPVLLNLQPEKILDQTERKQLTDFQMEWSRAVGAANGDMAFGGFSRWLDEFRGRWSPELSKLERYQRQPGWFSGMASGLMDWFSGGPPLDRPAGFTNMPDVRLMDQTTGSSTWKAISPGP